MKNDLVDFNNPLFSYSSSNTNLVNEFPEGYGHYTYDSHNLFEEKLMKIDNDTQLIIHLMYGDTKADVDIFMKIHTRGEHQCPSPQHMMHVAVIEKCASSGARDTLI